MNSNPKHQSQEEVDGKVSHSPKEQAARIDKKPRIKRLIIYGICVVLAGFMAQYVESFDHKLLISSLIIAFLVFVFSGYATRLELINYGATHRKATCAGLSIFFSGAVLLSGLFWWKHSQPDLRPRFTFVFSTADAPTARVELTNDFLVLTNFEHFEVCGDLVVPKKLDATFTKFKFGIRNDSVVVAELIEVSMVLPNDVLCLPDDGWVPGDPVGPTKMQSWVTREAFGLLPGNGRMLPDMRVAPIFPEQQFIPIAISARGKDSPHAWLGFSATFWPPSTNFPEIARPFVVFEPKKANGLRTFSLSSEKLKEFQK
jgi:hypothetical protein